MSERLSAEEKARLDEVIERALPYSLTDHKEAHEALATLRADHEAALERIAELERVATAAKSEAYLGNATTRDLLNELTARAELGGYINYRTATDFDTVRCIELDALTAVKSPT